MLGLSIVQVERSWHDGGMFIGMHWVWWLVWILTIAVILWALWQAGAERREMHRRVLESEAAEEVLRRRFARGEISKGEFADSLKLVHRSRLPSGSDS